MPTIELLAEIQYLEALVRRLAEALDKAQELTAGFPLSPDDHAGPFTTRAIHDVYESASAILSDPDVRRIRKEN